MSPKPTEWTAELVADYFEEAVSTIRKLPPVKVQGYFNSWPAIKHTPNELAFMEPRPIRLQATPDAVSRLEETFKWMAWVTVKERKLIWRRAARYPWKILCLELGYARVTVCRHWISALTKISNKLNDANKI